MLGAIIGDIVGSRFEFNNTNKTDFKLFTSECSFTDDTICTIAIADAILRSVSFEQSLLEWCRKYPNPKGAYGCSFSQWINSKTPTPYGSFGPKVSREPYVLVIAFISQEKKRTLSLLSNL